MSGTVDMKIQAYITSVKGSRRQLEALDWHYIGHNRNAGTEEEKVYIGDVVLPVIVREGSILVAQSLDIWLNDYNKKHGVILKRNSDLGESGWYASEKEKSRVRAAAASLVANMSRNFSAMNVEGVAGGGGMTAGRLSNAMTAGRLSTAGRLPTNLNVAARVPIADGSVIQKGYFGANRERRAAEQQRRNAELASAFSGMHMTGGARRRR